MGGEQDCAWPLCKSRRPSWEQGEDCRGLDQDLSDAQQAWQDRVEEGKRSREESLCTCEGLGHQCAGGEEGFAVQWFRADQREDPPGEALYAKSKALLAERKA